MNYLIFVEPSPLNSSANVAAGSRVSRRLKLDVGDGTTTSVAHDDVETRGVVGGIIFLCWRIEFVVLVDYFDFR